MNDLLVNHGPTDSHVCVPSHARSCKASCEVVDHEHGKPASTRCTFSARLLYVWHTLHMCLFLCSHSPNCMVCCVCRWEVLQELPQGEVMLELHPLTGRTHQLRVHLSAIGLPILVSAFPPMLRSVLPANLQIHGRETRSTQMPRLLLAQRGAHALVKHPLLTREPPMLQANVTCRGAHNKPPKNVTEIDLQICEWSS